MPHMFAKYLKTSILFILTTSILYIGMLFFHNGNTLIIRMDTNTHTKLYPQIYFKHTNGNFSEQNSKKAFKVKGNNYYFSLPALHTIQQLRFDPSKYKREITLYTIKVIQYNWFKKTVYDLDIHTLKPTYQIKEYKSIQHTIHFSTTGNDPQLDGEFSLKKLSKTHYLYLNHFMIAFLIVLILFYLFHIYKTVPLDALLSAKLLLYLLFLVFTIYKVNYYKEHIHFGYPPDELAHLSYIDYVDTHDDIIPTFETMTFFNDRKSGNYLSHPPLYYRLMDLVYDKSDTLVHNVHHFRTLSTLIFLTSFLLLLYLGFSTPLSVLGHFTYLTIISSLPMYAYLGASINNDNLAMLGATIFLLALKRAWEEQYTNTTYILLALGVFVAYFSKLTVAILIFFAVILFVIMLFIHKKPFHITKYQFLLLTLTAIPILSYQIYILTHFHAMVPTFNVTHPIEYLKSGFYVPEAYRQHLTHMEWLARMKRYVIEGWFNIHSHHSLIKANIWGYIGLLILHVFALISLFFSCKSKATTSCILGKITLISLFLLIVIQYIFSYNTHMHSGYLGGLQPRYLLPFMFAFAIMASLFVERFKKIFIFQIFIIIVCIQALYSDFFYFLNYYA